MDERRRATDPMITELIDKVDKLDVKLENHMRDETLQLGEIADNKERLDDLHTKVDSLLEFSSVWTDLKGFGKIVAKVGNFAKWILGLVAATAAAITAILNWPNGGA